MNELPVPHDLGLQLPLPEGPLKVLLVLVFLLHILFVNFMVGGITLSVVFELIGLRREKYDQLAHELSKTVTVNKSLAVVLGVAPLLAINLAYTVYFYSATILIGFAWLMLIPLVSIAFLLTYLHKYTWHRWQGEMKWLHLLCGLGAVSLFWFIPLIFLSNINLMLFPSRWLYVQGFLSALSLANVLPRYVHFMLATMAVSSLFAAIWFTRKNYPLDRALAGYSRPELRRLFLRITFVATALQFIVGPWVLLSLPVHGISYLLYGIILLGLVLAILFATRLWREVGPPHSGGETRWGTLLILLTSVVLLMAFGRHEYRERSIAPHRQEMLAKTEAFFWDSEAARGRSRLGITKTVYGSEGEKEFKTNCSVCHARSTTLVGPSLDEIIQIYQGKEDKLVEWAKAPGVKRGGVPMPSFKHLGDDRLHAIAAYILGR